MNSEFLPLGRVIFFRCEWFWEDSFFLLFFSKLKSSNSLLPLHVETFPYLKLLRVFLCPSVFCRCRIRKSHMVFKEWHTLVRKQWHCDIGNYGFHPCLQKRLTSSLPFWLPLYTEQMFSFSSPQCHLLLEWPWFIQDTSPPWALKLPHYPLAVVNAEFYLSDCLRISYLCTSLRYKHIKQIHLECCFAILFVSNIRHLFFLKTSNLWYTPSSSLHQNTSIASEHFVKILWMFSCIYEVRQSNIPE